MGWLEHGGTTKPPEVNGELKTLLEYCCRHKLRRQQYSRVWCRSRCKLSKLVRRVDRVGRGRGAAARAELEALLALHAGRVIILSSGHPLCLIEGRRESLWTTYTVNQPHAFSEPPTTRFSNEGLSEIAGSNPGEK